MTTTSSWIALERLQVTKRRDLLIPELKTRGARVGDCRRFLTMPFAAYERDELKIVYVPVQEDLQSLLAALQRVRYQESTRSSGMVTRSRVFGYQPRVTMRRDYCSATSLATEQPDEHHTIVEAARIVSQYYAHYNPVLFKAHMGLTAKKVQPDYCIPGIPFTSGIVNKNNPLRYHYDSGNFQRVWSCMLVFKQDVAGGHLNMPEYDISVELLHNTLFMFDGQKILHGVTPIELLTPNAVRFSVVFYSLRDMWLCLPAIQELERFKKVRNRREEKNLLARGMQQPQAGFNLFEEPQ